MTGDALDFKKWRKRLRPTAEPIKSPTAAPSPEPQTPPKPSPPIQKDF